MPGTPAGKKKLGEAMEILASLGFSQRQRNEVAGYTLLALLDLSPAKGWQEVAAPLRGITPVIGFIATNYKVRYAPNTRETIRDEAVKYFVEAGLLLRNPDHPERPVNSGKTVYQIEPRALELVRSYGSPAWAAALAAYIGNRKGVLEAGMRDRKLARIALKLPSGETVTISPGGQNPLIKQVIEEFCPRFVPGGVVLYIGDAENKFLHLYGDRLAALGVTVAAPDKMPDVIAHDTRRNWLVLIEAVTSAGPVDAKRKNELKRLFAGSTAGLVFVTAFADRKTMRTFLISISWETEVWIAENPDHLIHFNGERYLGPYPDSSSGN